MEAFHSFWSLPNSARNGGKIGYPDFEMLTAILSALYWQRENGPIRMITDSAGAEFFRNEGLGNLWNCIDTSLDQIDSTIDPILFWAAGKLYALHTMKMPCVMLDTDLIIWKNLDELWKWDVDVVAAHPEGLNPAVYPDPSAFCLRDGYHFPDQWDFSLDAANTAFLYLKDRAFCDYYVNEAIRFFQNIRPEGLNPVTAMCFAEQRILPMCAAEKGKSIGYLLDPVFIENQQLATHTWGFKTVLQTNPKAHHEFCMRLVSRIMKDFPERRDLLSGSGTLCKYYREYCLTINK